MTTPLVQMVLSLSGVVAMILGLAWLTRRLQGLRPASTSELRVRATLPVGMKERVVLIEACGQQILIGVAPGRVDMLKALGPIPIEDQAVGTPERRSGSNDAVAPTFADHLRTLLRK